MSYELSLVGPWSSTAVAVKQGDLAPCTGISLELHDAFKVMVLCPQKINESSFTPRKVTMCRDNYNGKARRKHTNELWIKLAVNQEVKEGE